MSVKKEKLSSKIINADIQNNQLTLAALYLEESFNEGITVEIPSLGISISKEGIVNVEEDEEV